MSRESTTDEMRNAPPSHVTLDEVVLIRLAMILQLIVYHSFIVYRGGWEKPNGFIEIPFYHQIADWSYAFMLPAFVAISGYLFYYQCHELGRRQSFAVFVNRKFKRLILPSILFSTIYFAVFHNHNSIDDTLYTILNGAGHLWFLPMLFLCYIAGWCFIKLQLGIKQVFAICLVMLLASFIPLPLRINSAMFYMIFFVIGMYLRYIVKRIDIFRISHILLLWAVFIILFTIWQLCEVHMHWEGGILSKLLTIEIRILFQSLYASVGVIAVFITARKFCKSFTIPAQMVKFSGYCFGVYIFQQFILQFLYYKTSLFIVIGAFIMPWIGIIITLLSSILLTHLTLKTKIGRILIG